MRYIAAVLLLKIAGVENPDAPAVKKVIEAGGVEVDEDRLNALLAELEGKDINEVCGVIYYVSVANETSS